MKKKIILCLTLASFLNTSFAKAEGASAPAPTLAVNPARAADPFSGSSPETDIKAALMETDQGTLAKAVYTFTDSDGASPSDYDIMITRRIGKIFSFKYCRSLNADGSANEIAQIRTLRMSRPDFFKTYANANGFLAHYFSSSFCQNFTPATVYGEKFVYDVLNAQSNTGADRGAWIIGGIVTGIGSVISSSFLIGEIAATKKQNNALGLFKYVGSSKFPWVFGTLSTVLISTTVGAFFMQNEAHAKNAKIDAFANSSYVYEYDEHRSNEKAMRTTYGCETNVSSMSEFRSQFLAGLDLLVLKKFFVRI